MAHETEGTENISMFEFLIFMERNRRYNFSNLVSGAPNDGFLPNALKRCFKLSGVLLKLCKLILGCAIKILSVRSF